MPAKRNPDLEDICTIHTLLKRAYYKAIGLRLNNEQVKRIYERDGDLHDQLFTALKAIVDCFGLGQSPEKFVEQVSGYIEDARALVPTSKKNVSKATEPNQ
jgi:hypothetical protein